MFGGGRFGTDGSDASAEGSTQGDGLDNGGMFGAGRFGADSSDATGDGVGDPEAATEMAGRIAAAEAALDGRIEATEMDARQQAWAGMGIGGKFRSRMAQDYGLLSSALQSVGFSKTAAGIAGGFLSGTPVGIAAKMVDVGLAFDKYGLTNKTVGSAIGLASGFMSGPVGVATNLAGKVTASDDPTGQAIQSGIGLAGSAAFGPMGGFVGNQIGKGVRNGSFGNIGNGLASNSSSNTGGTNTGGNTNSNGNNNNGNGNNGGKGLIGQWMQA
jgi:hypothetical protein